jgi:hypothetical protein
MYIFSSWFQELIEYLKTLPEFNIDDIKNAIENENILKGRIDIYLKYPEYITPLLSLKEEAIPILEKFPQHICWSSLTINTNAIPLLKKYPNKIVWFWLSKNTNAYELLLSNLDKLIFLKLPYFNIEFMKFINWYLLLTNPETIEIIKLYPNKIDWDILSNINHDKTIQFLNNNIDKINWPILSFNTSAIPILSKHIDKIDWYTLSLQPFAIDLLLKNPNKINWETFNLNENAIPLLKENLDKVNWSIIMFNKNGKEIIKNNEDKVKWTNWKMYTDLKYYINILDDTTYVYGSDYNLTFSDIINQLEDNYKYNLNYFNKCFVYKDLININDNEIINDIIDFNQPSNYILLLRDKQFCEYSELDKYKSNFKKIIIDKPLNQLIYEINNYIGPPLYSPVYALIVNKEFIEMLKTNPKNVFYIFKSIIQLLDVTFLSNLLYKLDCIDFDYQYLCEQRTKILREQLMIKALHPSRIQKWLENGLSIDDL